MKNRYAVAVALVSLSLFACDDSPDGYYWWDETRDVWCYQYANGDVVCDDATSCTNGYGYACSDTDPSASDDDTPAADGDGDSDTSGDGDSGDAGDSDPGTIDPTPPTSGAASQCWDQADGTRECVLIDGDRVCEFFYDSAGTVTGGTCALIDSAGQNSCQPAADGGLICTFDDPDGTSGCIVIFDAYGVVEFDPCAYFMDADS